MAAATRDVIQQRTIAFNLPRANDAYEASIAVAVAIWEATEAAAFAMMLNTIEVTRILAEGAIQVALANLQMSLATAQANAQAAADDAFADFEAALGSGGGGGSNSANFWGGGGNGISSNPDTVWGWGAVIMTEFGKGLLQGLANVGNAATDLVIGVANFAFNSTVDPYGLIPDLPAPDWSRDLVVPESDLDHAISKGAGTVAIIAGLAALGAASLSRPPINCFVAGTEVHMDNSPIAAVAESHADLTLAAACVPVAVAGYVLSRRKKQRPYENNVDDYFATYEPELC